MPCALDRSTLATGGVISTQSPPSPSGEPAGLPSAAAPVSGAAPSDARQKAAATVRRRKEERRAESLRDIRAQTAAGSLIVRQMTPAQQEAASEVGRETLARNEARGKRYRSPTAPDA